MKKCRAMYLLILLFTLISCASESSNNSMLIELHSPESNRQIVTMNSVEWKAVVHVNTSPAEVFYLRNSTSPLTVTIAGVQRDKINSILIKWFEMLNGHTVEMSVQEQSFFADGSTIINTPHLYTQFDYDGDGRANLVERSEGTCVWSATDSCVNPGQTDIPTDNAVLNGDFSDGTRYWYSELTEVEETSGEYCVSAPATALGRWGARIDYSPVPIFIDANASYNLVFDVRADTSSNLFVHMPAKILDSFKTLEEKSVAVSTTYESKSMKYESNEDAYSEVYISFTFGNDSDNTYCFDNIKLIRDAS